jgi:hypothetical protein
MMLETGLPALLNESQVRRVVRLVERYNLELEDEA